MTEPGASGPRGMSGRQQFILAMFVAGLASLPPTITAIVLYIKAQADRELVVTTVKATSDSARIDAVRTQGQLAEVDHKVNSRLDDLLNSNKILEEALRRAGVRIPPTPSTPAVP